MFNPMQSPNVGPAGELFGNRESKPEPKYHEHSVRYINDVIGPNGAYISGNCFSPEKGYNPRVFRARKRKGVLQFSDHRTWIDAPEVWDLVSGCTGRTILRGRS